MVKPRKVAAEAVFAAGFPRSTDPDVAWQQFNRMMAYELWVDIGRPGAALKTSEWPSIYLTLATRWPGGFEFYRHHAFAYVSSCLGYMPLGTMLEALVRRVATRDPTGFVSFIDVLRGAGERFSRQRIQATDLLRGVPGPDDPVERLRIGLAGYVHYYEIDFPLWFLGVVGKALASGVVDPEFLGGPASTTSQRSMIKETRSLLTATPFESAFDLAYDPELRNSIGHNDYELRHDGDSLELVDYRTGGHWSEDEAWDHIFYAQYLHHAVILAAQVAIARADAVLEEMTDIGILSFTWGDTHAGYPVVVVPQLWCFRDLDPTGAWIDSTVLEFDDSGSHSVSHLTTNATTEGPKVAGSATRLEGCEWAWVVRIPVAPELSLNFPSLETLEGERYEVVGPPDVHLVPLRVVGMEQNRAL